jgi:putative PIN family toxin of toxin-antitoxin system
MLSLRLILDTNIIVSAAIKPEGLQRTVLLLAMTRPARLYISDPILSEYRMVLQRPEFKIQKSLRLQFLQQIKNISHRVHPSRQIRATADPDDDIFLECADAARADYLVTGNLRHFPKFWKQTKIVSSREFITMITPHLVP